MTNETLKMELGDFVEMLRSDAEMASDSSPEIEKVIRNYLSDIEEIYQKAFGED
nr:MAG TPA: hypothetical protein [Caudoviricetes sp.]